MRRPRLGACYLPQAECPLRVPPSLTGSTESKVRWRCGSVYLSEVFRLHFALPGDLPSGLILRSCQPYIRLFATFVVSVLHITVITIIVISVINIVTAYRVLLDAPCRGGNRGGRRPSRNTTHCRSLRAAKYLLSA